MPALCPTADFFLDSEYADKSEETLLVAIRMMENADTLATPSVRMV